MTSGVYVGGYPAAAGFLQNESQASVVGIPQVLGKRQRETKIERTSQALNAQRSPQTIYVRAYSQPKGISSTATLPKKEELFRSPSPDSKPSLKRTRSGRIKLQSRARGDKGRTVQSLRGNLSPRQVRLLNMTIAARKACVIGTISLLLLQWPMGFLPWPFAQRYSQVCVIRPPFGLKEDGPCTSFNLSLAAFLYLVGFWL